MLVYLTVCEDFLFIQKNTLLQVPPFLFIIANLSNQKNRVEKCMVQQQHFWHFLCHLTAVSTSGIFALMAQ